MTNKFGGPFNVHFASFDLYLIGSGKIRSRFIYSAMPNNHNKYVMNRVLTIRLVRVNACKCIPWVHGGIVRL